MNIVQKIIKFLVLSLFLYQIAIAIESKPKFKKSNNVEWDSLFLPQNIEVTYEALFFISQDFRLEYLKKNPDIFCYCLLWKMRFETDNISSIKNNLFKKLTPEKKMLLEKWHIIDRKIKEITPMKLDSDINLTDVVFHMKQSRIFFDPYDMKFIEKGKQTSMISENAIFRIYFDIFNYLLRLDNKELEHFFYEYEEVYKKNWPNKI